MRDYDPHGVQPVGEQVDDVYVRRAVDAALEVDGLRALADDGHEFTIESVALQSLFDEDCLVGPGEAVPVGCAPGRPPLDGPPTDPELEEDSG